MWEPMLNKIKKRLTRWKGRHLSFVGRVSLINYVITSLPLFYLCFFKPPKMVIKEIDEVQRKL